MPTRPNYLQRRDGMYRLRMGVPDRLRAVIGKREITVSLDTADFGEARRRVGVEALKAKALLEAAERRLEAQKPPSERLQEPDLDEAALWGLMTRWFQSALRKDALLQAHDISVQNRVEEFDILTDAENTNIAAGVYGATVKFARAEGLDLEPQSPSFRRLSALIYEAMIERDKRLIARFVSHVPVTFNPRFADITEARTSPSLSSLIRRYTSDAGFDPGGVKAQAKRKAHHALIKEFFGAEVPVHEITRDDVGRFRDMLAARKIMGTKAVTGDRAAQGSKPVKTLSPDTANRYLEEGSRLMKFAVSHRLLDRNPFDQVRVKSDGVADEDRRLPFPMSDLKAIFSAPLYVGCRDDEHGYAVQGPNRPRRGRFWIPLICLLSGMGMNEACQLTEDDIQVVAGHDVFQVRRQVKTASSRRLIPINPELKRLGFMEHVAKMRALGPAGCSLFPELSVAKSGYASDNFSKFFARFLAKVGVNDPRLEFHSLRHNFADELARARVPADLADALGGWKAAGKSTRRRYGGSPEMRVPLLAAEMDKLSYPGLDLSHLIPD